MKQLTGDEAPCAHLCYCEAHKVVAAALEQRENTNANDAITEPAATAS